MGEVAALIVSVICYIAGLYSISEELRPIGHFLSAIYLAIIALGAQASNK